MKNNQNSIPLRRILFSCLSFSLIVLISLQMAAEGLFAQNDIQGIFQERSCAAINFIDPQFPQYGEHVFITTGLPTTNHPESISTAYWRSDHAGLQWSETTNTARLVGEVTNNGNEQERLYLDFQFVDRYNWAQWSALDRTFDSQGDDSVPYETWTYWQVSEGTIEGRGSLEGTLDISHRPANYLKGFQIGEQAHNPRVTGEGIGGWYNATGMLNSDAVALANGDVYAALDCSGEPRPTAASTATSTATSTVASTATSTATPTPTITPLPAATETFTAIPPTLTPTNIPPTATSIPPTPTTVPTAIAEDAPLIRVGHSMVAPGEEVTIVVESENIDMLATTTIEIMYDDSILRVVSCNGDPAREFNLAQCNLAFEDRNIVAFNVTSLFGVSGSPDLAEIVFEAIGQSGDISPIEITVRTFANPNGQSVETRTENGSVDIISARRGDVNCDGELNDIDTLLILRYDIGVATSGTRCSDPGQRSPNDAIDARICDVSGDSGCTPLDGLYIHRCNLGLESPLCSDGTEPEESLEQAVDTSAVLSLGTLSANAGQKASLPVMLNITEGNFNVSTIEIDYDPSKLRLTECLADPKRVFDMAACNMAYENDGVGLDTVRFNVLVGDGVDGIVQLAELRFDATETVDIDIAGLSADVIEFSDGSRERSSIEVDEDAQILPNIQLFLPMIYQ